MNADPRLARRRARATRPIACLALSAAATLWAAAPAQATTVYTFDTTITSASPTGNPLQTDTVIGTITTDGTLGVLRASAILDWNLQLIDGLDASNNVTLTHANSLLVEDGGGALSATATGLFFDFSGKGEFLIQISPYSGYHYFCFSTGGACLAGETIAPGYVSTDGVVLTGAAGPVGVQPLDTSPPPPPVSAVPEPSTWAMMALGLAGLGLLRRRARR